MTESEPNTSRKIWRAVLTGAAAVPIAVFAIAPAVGAAGTAPAGAASVEQLPPTPVPDPALLTDLQTCLADLDAALGETAPEPTPPTDGGAVEQAPAPPTEVPDLATLVEDCETLLATVQGTEAPAPVQAGPGPEEPAG